MKKAYTIAEISELAAIPNSTCRRYLTTFEMFFMEVGGSRLKKYETQAIDVLKRIKQLYDEGKDVQEIDSILKSEFPLVIDGDEEGPKTSLASTLATSEEVTELKKIIEQQMTMIKGLSDRLDSQQEYIAKRDEQLMKVLRGLREQKTTKKQIAAAKEKREWWRFWG